jgi:hypothetical protein
LESSGGVSNNLSIMQTQFILIGITLLSFSDDCHNIAEILKALISRGFVFEETSCLYLDKNGDQ